MMMRMLVGIGGEAPVILEGHLHADFAAVVGHLLERLDAVAEVLRDVVALGIAVGPGAGRRENARAAAVHAHGFRAEDFAGVEPVLGDGDAGFALLDVELADVARGVVGDVLALRAGGAHLVGEFAEPALAGVGGRVELLRDAGLRADEDRDLDVHAVVGDIAEEAGEEVHVGDAGEGVLGELGEVEHGDFAILLLHGVGGVADCGRSRCGS